MMYSNLDDQRLIALLQRGDGQAFEEIFSRYWKILYTAAYNIIQNEETAKDAVQDVFVSVWVRRLEVNIQSLKAYLSQAVRFQVLKAIRDQKADDQFYARLAEVTSDILSENPLLFKEQQALLVGIMNDLPEDCRIVFSMSREENLTYREIAARLGISEKTVEKKISICLKHIRSGLERDRALCLAIFLLPGIIF